MNHSHSFILIPLVLFDFIDEAVVIHGLDVELDHAFRKCKLTFVETRKKVKVAVLISGSGEFVKRHLWREHRENTVNI